MSGVPFPDPDVDFADLASNDDNDPTNFSKPGKGKKDGSFSKDDPSYILGTLVVRVVAARDLEPIQKGKRLSNFLRVGHAGGGTNPYASVKFGNTTQRTSEVFDTLDPIWPRQETMFMDVGLPLSELTHPEISESRGDSASLQNSSTPSLPYEKPNTVMTVALFHTPDIGSSKFPTKGGGIMSGDSDDMFLGMASTDLTRLLTGIDTTYDEWLTLTGTESSLGSVRIVCEYEPTDPSPRRGDFCRFTRYCHPMDLYPLVPGKQYYVEGVEGDVALVTYTSQEGWVCSFEAHRYMLICQENQSPVETAQDEIVLIAERLSHSPLLHSVTETIERVAVDGLLNVGQEAVRGGWGILNRWMDSGVETAINDVTNVTNWDGRYNPDNDERLNLPEAASSDSLTNYDDDNHEEKTNHEESINNESAQALQGMPCCPITGEPMIDPVVVADGHTYERNAISRWFKTSNKSPLTGAVLRHKELVNNYMLLSSVQEAAAVFRASHASPLKFPPPNQAAEETILFESDKSSDSS